MTGLRTSKCPYCAEEIKPEAIKCKHCGEWLKKEGQDISKNSKNTTSTDTQHPGQKESKEKQPEKLPTSKIVIGIITLIAFAFVGHLMGNWIGLIVGIFLWLVAVGSIGLTKDISDAGEAARRKNNNK